MRKLNLVLIVIFSLIALLIIAVLVGGIVFQNSGSIGIIGGADGPTSIFVAERSGNRELLLDKNLPAEGIDSVELNLSSEAVDIYESGDGQFRVVHYGRNLEKNRYIAAEKVGSALVIDRPHENVTVFNFGANQQSWVELYLPAEYLGAMDVQMSSGSVRAHSDLTLSDFSTHMSSGSFKSGVITAGNASIRMTSGSMNLAQVDAEQFEIELSSGSVSIDHLSGSGSAQLTSGTLRLNNTVIDENLSIRASSGTVSIGLAEDPSLQFHGKASSGNISTYFDVYYTDDHRKECFATVGDAPHKKMDVQITSGNIRVTSVGGSEKSSEKGGAENNTWDEFEEEMERFAEEMDRFADSFQ